MTRMLSPKYPELVFGIAGPIGIDIDSITRVLLEVLKTVAYRSQLIKITDEARRLPSAIHEPENKTFYNVMRFKMAHASQLCREKRDSAFLMRLAMSRINEIRKQFIEMPHELTTEDDFEKSVVSDVTDLENAKYYLEEVEDLEIAHRSAYIIRQIKRPGEVELLRQVDGKQFILVSAYGSEIDRHNILVDKIRTDSSSTFKDSRAHYLAQKLIELDADEEDDEFGQHTRDAFHLADVVIDGISVDAMRRNLTRFIDALFGANDIAPTKSEFGMATAHLASLRSSDLSRQVGAAIFAADGSLLVQGCNEVPKAFGGTYWDGEAPDYRDIKIGRDSNDILKIDVLKDLVDRLKSHNLLRDEVAKSGSSTQIVNFLIGRSGESPSFNKAKGALKNSKVLDLTEYGRVVHAEMNAICDGARNGIALRDSVLFTTTFPCHNCTKHILASGISEVFFLEPYPKSKAKELHSNEIAIEVSDEQKVSFRPFIGITPYRYKDIFLKSKRKDKGRAVRWQHGAPAPMLDIFTAAHVRLEEFMMYDHENGEASFEGDKDSLKTSAPQDSTGEYNAEHP